MRLLPKITSNDNKIVIRFFKSTFVVGVAAILILALGTYVIVNFALIESGFLSQNDENAVAIFWVVAFSVFCLAIGIGLSLLLGKILIEPIRNLIYGMTQLSEGDFSARVNLGPYLDKNTQLSTTFNNLAERLQDTEILRSDFVNNFSHEVKTPLVSITGLVSLLKNDNLPKEKRLQYIELIEEEIQRLSSMTTNMLSLSKLEKQDCLHEQTYYNVSEQIRKCVLLLEKKWTQNNTNIALDFDEFSLYADKTLMQQVWINLLDNAIKFSGKNGNVSIAIEQKENDLKVSISNTGEKIEREKIDKIFNKFYQGDTSRNKDGNGIGLSIVDRIIYLHNGKIEVDSNDERTIFVVTLPLLSGQELQENN